jgi:hypothetical protein
MHKLKLFHFLVLNTLFTIWINLEDVMIGEISQTVKDKQCMISLISDTE